MKVLLAALFCLVVIWARAEAVVPRADDFRWAVDTAQAILKGNNPYAFEPSAERVPYPLPVALFGLPFLRLPAEKASNIFFGISSGLLMWGILRSRQYWRLWIFLSFSYCDAWLSGQWTPLIAASWYVPALAPLLGLVKPQSATPVVLARWRWFGGLIAAAVLALSLVIWWRWPLEWFAMIEQYEAVYPLKAPIGWLLLAAIFFLHKSRGRLLLGATFMPFRAAYDWLPLGVVPSSSIQMMIFSALTWGFPVVYVLTDHATARIGLHLFCLLCLI